MIRTQGESVLYVCTKFEADSYMYIRSTVIRGPKNFEIRSRDPKPYPF